MKKYLFVIFITLSTILYGQDINVAIQKYYVLENYAVEDKRCCLVYQVRNVSATSQVVMFTEDDVNSMPLEKLIKRKLLRRYGDFYLAFFIWDPNTENDSEYVLVPEYFVKMIEPGESFCITLFLQNEDDHLVDSLFRRHLLICNLEDIEGSEMFHGFKHAIDVFHLEFPYPSITLLWNDFTPWLQRQGSSTPKTE